MTSAFSHFRTQLLLLMLLLLLPALGLALFGNLEQRGSETERAREAASAISHLAAANQENFIKNTRQLLATLTQFPFLMLSTNEEECRMQFLSFRSISRDYLDFGLLETNGLLFTSAEPAPQPINASDRSYFQRVLHTKKFATGDFQFSRVTGEPSLNFGQPVFDEHGNVRRVLYASLKLSRLSQALAPIRLPPGSTLTVFDRKGTIIARNPDPDLWIGKCLSNTPVVKRMLDLKEGVIVLPGLDAIPRLHALTAIWDSRSPALYVSVGIPRSASFATADEALVRNLLVLGLVAVLVWLVARQYAQRFFLEPVLALASAARRLAEGDLNSRAGPVPGAAELVELGRTFDVMAGRLQSRQAELERAHVEIARFNRELEARVAERTAQLAAANKELEAFSYSVSHDLRAPLRAVEGFTRAVQEDSAGQLSPQGREDLDRVRAAARRMSQLIDDLLALSRVNRSGMRRTKVDLSMLAENILGEIHKRQPEREVKFSVAPGLIVNADANLLRITLENLLGNAWKFTSKQPQAHIAVGMCTQNGAAAYFVRDNGAGFDMAYASKLFGAFQRLHHTSEFEGSGIGLATVQRIIHLHGGRVWAEGEPDKGASFYFTLGQP